MITARIGSKKGGGGLQPPAVGIFQTTRGTSTLILFVFVFLFNRSSGSSTCCISEAAAATTAVTTTSHSRPTMMQLPLRKLLQLLVLPATTSTTVEATAVVPKLWKERIPWTTSDFNKNKINNNNNNYSRRKQVLVSNFSSRYKRMQLSLQHSSILVRGGSTTTIALESDGSSTTTTNTTTSTTKEKTSELHSYRMQQQLYLQSRSLLLREALIQRGLEELQHTPKDTKLAVPIDWDCAMSTHQSPKSCLYSLDAEIGSKVIAPAYNTSTTTSPNWITLTALNRLRRNEPTKIEPLWHSQYQILQTWFAPNHPFSLYTHLHPVGTILALMLDTPLLLMLSLSTGIVLAAIVLFPLWEVLFQSLLCTPLLWKLWPQWGRFVHAAMPLKLLLGQMLLKVCSTTFQKLYTNVRTHLIEWECQILEECTPLTILDENENGMEKDENDEEEEEDDDVDENDNDDENKNDDDDEEEDVGDLAYFEDDE